MNDKLMMDIHHFSDEISALAREFAHYKQDELVSSKAFQEWISLFVGFLADKNDMLNE